MKVSHIVYTLRHAEELPEIMGHVVKKLGKDNLLKELEKHSKLFSEENRKHAIKVINELDKRDDYLDYKSDVKLKTFWTDYRILFEGSVVGFDNGLFTEIFDVGGHQMEITTQLIQYARKGLLTYTDEMIETDALRRLKLGKIKYNDHIQVETLNVNGEKCAVLIVVYDD